MKKYILKIKSFFVAHKIISTVLVIVLLSGGYYGYKKFNSVAGDTRYLTAKVSKGTIVASVSGSGQVSASNQVEVRSKVAGDIIYLGAKNGSKVGTGTLIAEIDNKDAQKTIRDAELSLQSAQISLDKLKLQDSADNMNADLAKAYDDGFNAVSNAFIDLPTIVTGLDDMFFKSNTSTGQWNIDWYEGLVRSDDLEKVKIYKNNLTAAYNVARLAYDASFENYKSVSRNSSPADIEKIISSTYDTTKLVSDAVKSANNYIDFITDSIQRDSRTSPALIATHKASLSDYTAKANSHLVALLSIETSIKNFKDAFPSASLDTQAAELTVKQRENSLQDAKDKLADYFVRAPFPGTLSVVNVKKGDSISAGTSVATLITTTQLAEISMNEVDVAKIKIGQKATLTFDAVPDLSVTGVVAEIDSVGTVSQGVVTYNVKISFDTQDVRIKPSMSVSAAIITNIKQDVLVAPNSAIKSQNGQSYVEEFTSPLPLPTDGGIGSISKVAPTKIPVEVGLSNDSETEIVSGINEGDEIVVRTIAPTVAKTTTAAPSLFGSPGGNRSGTTGGNVRIQAR